MTTTLTLPTPELMVAATLLGLFALSALIFRATTPHRPTNRSDQPWTLRALNTFGVILAPIRAPLICATIIGPLERAGPHRPRLRPPPALIRV